MAEQEERSRSREDKGRGEERRGREDRRKRESAPASDLREKVLYINRCTKVVKGGKKMSFSALILVGDGKGSVGFGFAKANELTDAIRKGGELARKNLTRVVMEGVSIPHDILVKWDGVSIYMRPAPGGTGIIAGSKVRAVLEFAGFKDVMAKNYGSSNPINQVRATFKALSQLVNRDKIMAERGVL